MFVLNLSACPSKHTYQKIIAKELPTFREDPSQDEKTQITVSLTIRLSGQIGLLEKVRFELSP